MYADRILDVQDAEPYQQTCGIRVRNSRRLVQSCFHGVERLLDVQNVLVGWVHCLKVSSCTIVQV